MSALYYDVNSVSATVIYGERLIEDVTPHKFHATAPQTDMNHNLILEGFKK